MSTYTKGFFLLFSATILFAIAHSCVAFLGSSLSIFQLAFLRFITAPIILLPLLKFKRFNFSIDNWPMIGLRTFFGISAMLLYFWALINGTPGQVSLIFQSSAIWASILAWYIFKEKLSLTSIVSIILAFIGLYFILAPSNSLSLTNANSVALLASVLNAGVFISLKMLRQTNNSHSILLSNYSLSATILFIPSLQYAVPKLSMVIIVACLAIAILGFIGNWCMTIGFKYCPANLSGTIMLLTVPWMYFSGIFFFNEQLNLLSGIGSIIVFVAILIIAWKK